MNPEPPAGGVDVAASCVPGTGGLADAAGDPAGGAAVDADDGAADDAAGVAIAVDDGETDLVVEDAGVPVQPASITAITTIPTRAEKNFLTLIYLLILINTSSI